MSAYGLKRFVVEVCEASQFRSSQSTIPFAYSGFQSVIPVNLQHCLLFPSYATRAVLHTSANNTLTINRGVARIWREGAQNYMKIIFRI